MRRNRCAKRCWSGSKTTTNSRFPESLVERQLQIRVQRLMRDLSRQGINPQRLDVDWGKIREDQQQQAVRDVKGSLILDYISEKENIAVTDDEIEAEIDKIAAETNRPKEKVQGSTVAGIRDWSGSEDKSGTRKLWTFCRQRLAFSRANA